MENPVVRMRTPWLQGFMPAGVLLLLLMLAARLLPGHGSGGWNRALNGSVRLLQYLPSRLPDTQLQGLVNQS